MGDKAVRARGRPRKEKTIYSKKEEPVLVNEVVTPVTPVEVPKVEPSNAIAEVVPIVEVKTDSIKIPIKVPQKKGKQDKLQGKQILTIIDEPIKPLAEPVKEVIKEEPKEPKKSLKTKASPKSKEPKPVKLPKVKPVKQAKAPKAQARDEDLYRMVYQLQQSVSQKAAPRRKSSKYVPSDDDDSSDDDETEEEEEDDDRFHKKIQRRLETVQHIEKRLKEVRQPVKGKYEHLSVF